MKLTINLSLAAGILLFITTGTTVAVDQYFQADSFWNPSAPIIIAEENQTGITEDEAAVIASNVTGGQVISSDTRGIEGVTVYRFRVLMSDGQVKIIQVKASTGEIL